MTAANREDSNQLVIATVDRSGMFGTWGPTRS